MAAILIGRYHIRVAGEFQKGCAALDTVYDRFDGEVSGGVVYWRGNGLLSLGDTEGALGQFKKWESLGQGECRERLRAGFMDHHGLYGTTLTGLLDSLSQMCEPSASLYLLLGKDLARQGHYEKAKVQFEKAIELAPTRVLYQNELRKLPEPFGGHVGQ
jgi:tetratricopeptide (TPR) repeat protein